MENTRDRPKVGVIGTGRMGQYHVNVYSEMPEVELVGVADLSEERGRAVAEKYRIGFFRDFRELLKAVDVVSIAVPTKLHYEIGKQVLEAGVHAIIEKPVTDDYAKAEELFSLADKKGLVLHVGHVERFNGAVRELHKIVVNPLLIQCSRMGPYDPRVGDDSVVLDLMIHDIDIVLGLVDSEVRELNVVSASHFSKVEDVVNVQVKFACGTLATFTASRVTQSKQRIMTISCPEHFVSLNFTDQDIQVHRLARTSREISRQELKYREESSTERIFVHRDNPLRLELRHLIDCVSGADRRVSVEKELASLRLALMILERCRRGG